MLPTATFRNHNHTVGYSALESAVSLVQQTQTTRQYLLGGDLYGLQEPLLNEMVCVVVSSQIY